MDNESKFTYLGQTFSNKDQGNFIDLRVSKAIGKFNDMRQVLTDQKVNMSTRKANGGMGACYPASYMEHKPGLSMKKISGNLEDFECNLV